MPSHTAAERKKKGRKVPKQFTQVAKKAKKSKR